MVTIPKLIFHGFLNTHLSALSIPLIVATLTLLPVPPADQLIPGGDGADTQSGLAATECHASPLGRSTRYPGTNHNELIEQTPNRVAYHSARRPRLLRATTTHYDRDEPSRCTCIHGKACLGSISPYTP